MKWFSPGAPVGWWQSPEESSSLTSILLLEPVFHSHPSTRRDVRQCSQNSSNIAIFILRIENWPDNSISADKCWHYLELNVLWKDSAADICNCKEYYVVFSGLLFYLSLATDYWALPLRNNKKERKCKWWHWSQHIPLPDKMALSNQSEPELH